MHTISKYITSITLLDIALILLIIFTFIAKYLVINKIWIRKHEPEVADSISIIAVITEILIITPFLVISITNLSIKSMMLETITLTSHLFLFFIGLGIWVNNGLRFKDKFARTFKIERKEYKSLVKELIEPRDMNKVFSFICMFAILDKELHEQEEILLKKFAHDHNLNYKLTMANVKNLYAKEHPDSQVMLMKTIRNQIKTFLNTSPPREVAIYLEDIIMHLVHADKDLTPEENIVASEISIMLENYLLGDGHTSQLYSIVVVPQSVEQEEAIIAVNARFKETKTSISGTDNAYVIDSYYSQEFAEMIKDRYIKLFKCFVTIEIIK